MTNNEKLYCVYKHTSPNGKVYIGITCKNPPELRWSNGNGYKKGHPHFWNAIQKYGWDNFQHEILFENLNREDACVKEQEMIALYNSSNQENGYNQTKGGDGKLGYVMSDETKQKISNSKIGRFTGEDNPNYGNHKLAGTNNPFYGKKHTDETKQYLSEIKKGQTSPMKGKHFSGQALENIKNACKERQKAVLQFDLNGNFLNKFNNAKDAAIYVGGNAGPIHSCCSGKTSMSYNFLWIYEEDYNVNQPIQKKPRKQRDLNSYFTRPILQYTLDDTLINEYPSAANASKITNINVSCIRDCCKKNQKTAGGFIWRYVDDKKN